MNEPSAGPTRSTAQGAGWIVGIAVGLVFVPLLLSVVESVCFGTHHVEDCCRLLGIYDALTKVYTPVFYVLTGLFRLLRGH